MTDKDNPQETVTDMEIGWLAGIIEGEGSICLTVHKRADRLQQVRVTPKIIITNTDQDIIGKCESVLRRLNVGRWVHTTKPNNIQKAKQLAVGYKAITYIEVVGIKRLHSLLQKILPCLVGEKKKRAELLFLFTDGRLRKEDQMDVTKSNFRYDNVDIGLLGEFIDLTKSPNKKHIHGILNEYTRGSCFNKRLKRDSGLARECKRQSEMVVRQLCIVGQ